MNFPSQASFKRQDFGEQDRRGLFPAIYEAAHDAIRTAYPKNSCQFGHHLPAHPLFNRPAITALARRHASMLIEREIGDNAASGADVLTRVEKERSWLNLREIDREAGYDALMRTVLKEIKPTVSEATGAMMHPEARLIIASPNVEMPLGFDEDYAVHFQLSGASRLMRYPVRGNVGTDDLFDEKALSSAPQNLRDDPRLSEAAVRHELSPGEALYVPAFLPYRTIAHGEVSVTLVLSWRSRWSIEYAGACRFNVRMRDLGAKPLAAHPYPKRNWAKSALWRAWQTWDKLRVVVR